MKRRPLLAACTLVFAFAPAHASVSITVVLDALVEASDAACVETPLEAKSVWEGRDIATYTRVRVDRVLTGTLPSEVWVRTTGGVVGGMGERVEGEAVLRIGQPSVLFVASESGHWVVTARGQGQFPIVAMRLRKNVHAGALLPPRILMPAAADVLDGRSVDDAAVEITAAWNRTHAKP